MQKLFLILLLSFPTALFAAADTTKVKPKPFIETIKRNSFFESDSLVFEKVTDTLRRFHDFNPVYPNHYKFLGNLGSAHQSLIFNPLKSIGPEAGRHQLDLYFFDNEDVRYYRTNRRFTELYYTLGSKREQILNVIHSQTIFKGLNVGINFKRITTEGNLNRQYVYGNNFNAFLRYDSPNKKYHILANGAYNRLSTDENGGITDEKELESDSRLTKNISVNLQQAETRWGNGSLFLQQSFDIGRDSLKKPIQRITHSIFYESRHFLYDDHDPANSFYPGSIISDLTLDSTSFKNLKNQLSWNYFGKNKYRLAFIHQQYRYKQSVIGSDLINQTLIDSSLNSTSAIVSFNIKVLKNLECSLDANTILSGVQNGDYFGKGTLSINIFSGKAGIEVDQQLKSPDIIYNRYYGNNFQWSNEFKKTQTRNYTLFYHSEKFKLNTELRYSNISNFIFFNASAFPEQYNKQLNLFQAVLNKTFKWKRWYFDNFLCYQNTDKAQILHLPEFLSSHSLYYEDNFFKKALYAQFGTDVRFNSYVYGDAYMPATGQFYLQNKTVIGNYPVIDVFINFRIKSARFGVKYEHVNYKLFPGGVNYLIPSYPMPGRVLKFAISWRFMD